MPGFTILINTILDILDNRKRQETEIKWTTGKQIKSTTTCDCMIDYPENLRESIDKLLELIKN